MKMFIDKFYRMHSPYYSKTQSTTTTTTTTSPQYRSSKPIDSDWDTLNYKVVNVKAGVGPNDASNMSQTLTREDFYFVQGKNKYIFIEESKKDGKWDGRNRVLKNIKDGVETNSMSSTYQVFAKLPNPVEGLLKNFQVCNGLNFSEVLEFLKGLIKLNEETSLNPQDILSILPNFARGPLLVNILEGRFRSVTKNTFLK